MKQNDSFISHLLNGLYFFIVFVFALAFSTLALVRKVNSYDSTRGPLILHVDKEDIDISNYAPGKVESINVKTGQHIEKGQLILQMSDDATEAKISTLEKVSKENVSARTEVLLLKAQSSQYDIRAPRDGIVYRIDAVEGSYLNPNSSIAKLFADGDIKLTAIVDTRQYTDIQKIKIFEVYSPRLEQTYSVIVEGIGRVIGPGISNKSSLYEVHFKFVNPEDGISFIEGEDLEVIAKNNDLSPANMLKKFWNSFILGS